MSIIPVCHANGVDAALDVVIDSPGMYAITIDGETVADVNGPTSGVVGPVPTSGEAALVDVTDVEAVVLQSGTYDLDCQTVSTVAVDPPPSAGDTLPHTGGPGVAIALAAAVALAAGTRLVRA